MIHYTDKPPILGGRPGFSQTLGLIHPLLPTVDEIKSELDQILGSGMLTNNGPQVVKFEEDLADYLGVKHCIAVANGTLGLMITLRALGVNDEVVMPSFTFAATADAASWCNLKLKFADIDPETYTINPQEVSKAVNSKTKAIVGVHTYGVPCDIDVLSSIAKENNIKLIFDATHALGSSCQGKLIGGFGDAEVFSFHASKILPMGEGGAIATNDDKLAGKLSALRNFGDVDKFDYRYIGLNAKLSEIPALLGRHGLRRLPAVIKHRAQLAKHYRNHLKGIKGVGLQTFPTNATLNYQYFPITIDKEVFGLDCNQLISLLSHERIETRRYFYPPVHMFPCYQNQSKVSQRSLAATEDISRRIICLPIHSKMDEKDADGVCSAIERIWHYRVDIRRKIV